MNDKQKLIEVFKRLQNDEPNAFDELYRLTEKYVRYIAYSVCHDNDMVEDILQESYISIYQKCKTINDLNTIKSWISSIVTNKALDMLRKNSKTVLINEDEEFLFENEKETDTFLLPAESADNKETQRLVREIIDKLPEMQKIIIIETEYNELKIKEVSELYGIPEGTVKTYRRKAKEFIKTEVEALAKKYNTKLYAVPMAPVLYLVIRNSILDTATKAAPVGLTAAIGVSKNTAKTGLKVTATKLLASTASLAVLGGGIYGVQTIRSNEVRAAISNFENACNENTGINQYFTNDIQSVIDQHDINLERSTGFFDYTPLDDMEIDVEKVDMGISTASVLCKYKMGDKRDNEGYLRLVNEDGWKIDLSNYTVEMMLTADWWGMTYDSDILLSMELEANKDGAADFDRDNFDGTWTVKNDDE